MHYLTVCLHTLLFLYSLLQCHVCKMQCDVVPNNRMIVIAMSRMALQEAVAERLQVAR